MAVMQGSNASAMLSSGRMRWRSVEDGSEPSREVEDYPVCLSEHLFL